jgi:hypothetical protein
MNIEDLSHAAQVFVPRKVFHALAQVGLREIGTGDDPMRLARTYQALEEPPTL